LDDVSTPVAARRRGCTACREGAALDFPITMAFQPIVDVATRSVYGYEALVRGIDGEGAAAVLARVNADNRYAFDQACRTTAIRLAAETGLAGHLSINFLPNAVYEPAACIAVTLRAAEQWNFPLDRIVFEVSESEEVLDPTHLRRIFDEYRRRGFRTALDDFGTGFSNLRLLADLRPDVVKLDRSLVHRIEQDRGRRAIVRALQALAEDLAMTLVAEGVETADELAVLADLGVGHCQGFLIARPALGALPAVDFAALDSARLAAFERGAGATSVLRARRPR
jgi:EAL domain-containing protein (putative c-di-GMP-specific phosphodiesterase class I)